MRKLLVAGMAAIACLAVLAGPAAAKKATPPPFTYTATIDCGHGPMVVGSYDDLWAPLEDLATGRRYEPVQWDVAVGEHAIHEVKPGKAPKRTVVCSYDDGVAKGTVTIKAPKGDRHDRGDDGDRGDD
jgi:hypothetical protein